MVLEGLQFYRLGLKGFLVLQFDFIIERQYNGFNGHRLHFLNNLI